MHWPRQVEGHKRDSVRSIVNSCPPTLRHITGSQTQSSHASITFVARDQEPFLSQDIMSEAQEGKSSRDVWLVKRATSCSVPY